MRVLLSGGGTGGHLFPAIRVAEELADVGHEVAFIGRSGGLEDGVVQGYGWAFTGVPASALQGSLRPGHVVDFVRAARVAHRVIREWRPDVLFATGGYAALVASVVQSLRGGRMVIHEANAYPGRTNRLLSPRAHTVCVLFQSALAHLRCRTARVTGLPVQRRLEQALTSRDTARQQIGLGAYPRVLFVCGGSQGAVAINSVVWQALERLRDAGVAVVHQVGARNIDSVPPDLRNQDGYLPVGFAAPHEMALYYSAASLVLSRAGASTIAEWTLAGRPAVLVPYPYAHADHQRRNAEVVQRAGAARMVPQPDLTPDTLCDMAQEILDDAGLRASMEQAARRWSAPDAPQRILSVLQEVTIT